MPGEVIVKWLEAIHRNRHLLPLVPLTVDGQQPKIAVDVAEPQPDQFTHTQASIDKDTQDSAVTSSQRLRDTRQPPAIAILTRRKKSLYLVRRVGRDELILDFR